MLKLRHALLAAALLLPAALVPAPASAQEKITIGVSLAQDDNPFYIAMLRGIRARAQELGWEVATVSANEDKVKQINGVQDLVARGVKGILISPIDAVGVNAAYDAAKAGNVPIVSVARGSTSPNQTLHVAMDEKQIGRDIAEWTAKAIGGEGKVAMLLGPSRRADVPQSRRRLHRGDGEASEDPDRVEERRPADPRARRQADRGRAGRQSGPQGDLHRQRRRRARRDAGGAGRRARTTLVTGMNGVPPALRAVKDGKMAMTIELNPVLWGRLGVDVLAQLSQGRQGRAAGVHQARHHRQDQHRREAAEDLRGLAMADAAAAAKPKSDFVAQLEAANLHPLWDRFRTLTPVKPQAKDPPLHLALEGHRAVHRARGVRGARSTTSSGAR